MTLGVVIPVYRCEDTIGDVVDALFTFAKAQRILCRVALVEDHSDDGTREAVLALAKRHTGVTVVLMAQNVGQQRALYTGLAYLADCDLIATMDDDGAHPIALLPSMMSRIEQGADLCYAVPRRKGYRFSRKVGALLRDGLFRACLGAPRGIRVSAYRVMSRQLALSLTPERDGFIYLSAAAMRYKPKVACLFYDAPIPGATTYTLLPLMRLYWGLVWHYTPLAACAYPQIAVKPTAHTLIQGRGFLWQP